MVFTIPKYPLDTTLETTDAAYLYESTTRASKRGSPSPSAALSALAAEVCPTPTLADRNSARITRFPLRRRLRRPILRRARRNRRESLARDRRPRADYL